MQTGYSIEFAQLEHVPQLAVIERAAAELFPDRVLTPKIRSSVISREQLIEAQAQRWLWVALTDDDPVGFAIVVPAGDSAFLLEIDVHPDHQRRGLGRRLMHEVVSAARTRGFACVELTTFEYLPWNAPFYERLGFRKLAGDDLSIELSERLQAEQRDGLRERVAMRLTFQDHEAKRQSSMTETIVCVGAVVKNAQRVLLVRQAAGHSLAGQWTIPWGRVEPGESAAHAARREAREEAGIVARLSGFIGVQELPDRWSGWLALIYECEHVSGEPQADGRETDAARYFSASELATLEEPIEPWSAWLVRRVFAGDVALIARSDTSNPFHPSMAFL